MLTVQKGLDVAIGFVDRVIRPADVNVVEQNLAQLAGQHLTHRRPLTNCSACPFFLPSGGHITVMSTGVLNKGTCAAEGVVLLDVLVYPIHGLGDCLLPEAHLTVALSGLHCGLPALVFSPVGAELVSILPEVHG